MNLDGALQTFFAEAEELLQAMESGLLSMEEGNTDAETLNAVFRAAHTIKGSAGLFGLDNIVSFTHILENVLDRVRDGKVEINSALLSALLPCRDHIATLVDDVMNQRDTEATCLAKGKELLAALEPWLDDSIKQKPAATALPGNAAEATPTFDKSAWHISVRLGPDLLRNGMDPLSILRYLRTLGDITHITTLTDNLPPMAAFDPETLYLGFEITLYSDADQGAIEDAFMFVREDSRIQIIPPRSHTDAYISLIKSLPENTHRLGEILVKSHAVTYQELEQALSTQKQQAKELEPVALLGDILVRDQAVAPALVNAALDKQKKNAEKAGSQENKFIRVDAERLDHLINLIGELVINRQRVDLLAGKLGNSSLIEAVNSMGNFTEQIRDAALTLRMVPIGDTFQRFKRVVRDTAKELGKDIQLDISGAVLRLSWIAPWSKNLPIP